MGRWLAAVLVLLGALAAGLVAFLNGGAPVAIALTPRRTVTLPLGVGLALAFAAGAALVALLALGGAVARAWRRGAAARARARTAKGVARARVHAETLLVGGDAEAARSRLTTAVTAHGPDEHLLALMAG